MYMGFEIVIWKELGLVGFSVESDFSAIRQLGRSKGSREQGRTPNSDSSSEPTHIRAPYRKAIFLQQKNLNIIKLITVWDNDW